MIDYVDTIDKHCYCNPQINTSDITCILDNNSCNDLDSIYICTKTNLYW